jgi:hypothetical protein
MESYEKSQCLLPCGRVRLLAEGVTSTYCFIYMLRLEGGSLLFNLTCFEAIAFWLRPTVTEQTYSISFKGYGQNSEYPSHCIFFILSETEVSEHRSTAQATDIEASIHHIDSPQWPSSGVLTSTTCNGQSSSLRTCSGIRTTTSDEPSSSYTNVP